MRRGRGRGVRATPGSVAGSVDRGATPGSVARGFTEIGQPRAQEPHTPEERSADRGSWSAQVVARAVAQRAEPARELPRDALDRDAHHLCDLRVRELVLPPQVHPEPAPL